MYLIIDTKSHISYTVFNDEQKAIEYKNNHPNTDIVLLTHGIVNEILNAFFDSQTDDKNVWRSEFAKYPMGEIRNPMQQTQSFLDSINNRNEKK